MLGEQIKKLHKIISQIERRTTFETEISPLYYQLKENL